MTLMLPYALCWHGQEAAVLEPEYLIHTLLPKRGVGLLLGDSGVGKSFIAIHLATCMATGMPFLNWPVADRGGTLLVIGEGLDTVPIRLEASLRALPPHRRPSSDQLPICWIPASSPQLARDLKSYWRKLGTKMQADYGFVPKLIIIDTLTTAMNFTDENNASEVTRAMAALQDLSRSADAFVLAIVHPKKGSSAVVRGSNVFKAAADLILRVDSRRTSGQPSARSGRISVLKCRFGEEGRTERFRLMSIPITEKRSSCFVQHDPGVMPNKPKTDEAIAPKVTSATVLLECINRLQELGFGIGATQSAIPIELVRSEFNQSWNSDSKMATDLEAKRKAFSRGLTALRTAKAIIQSAVDGETVIMLRPVE